jgi:hypothetical protein
MGEVLYYLQYLQLWRFDSHSEKNEYTFTVQTVFTSPSIFSASEHLGPKERQDINSLDTSMIDMPATLHKPTSQEH